MFQSIREWAASTPDKPALVGRELSLSYSDLEARTNQVARALRGLGIGCGDRVSFVLPRGPQTIILLIGVLKSGAAYVPLDSESPITRIKDCLEDAQPRLVIVDDDRIIPEEDPPLASIRLKEVFAAAAKASSEPLEISELGLESSDLAYMIFTSGTTGRPKGVPISHAALTNFVRGDQRACIRVETSDRVFQGFSPASDGHHEEIWPTLLAGATLVIATSKEIYSGADLASFLNDFRVTIISCAPTLLSMVDQDVPFLKRILFGAENLPAALVKRWWKPDRQVLNTYGPTEATVGATFSVCEPGKPVTIGKPLPNYYCYVLDDASEIPIEATEGQLAIAGVGVAEGYFGRPDLSAAKFVPNPFGNAETNSLTLYLTGDRVRREANGDIVWLGRVDSQVKIRGHRIELSEIESHILAHTSVQSGVVITRDAEDGDVQLVALIAVREGAKFDVVELLSDLRDALPGYMVPQMLEQVDQIPRLPSGKVDRRACQLLHGQVFRIEREITPPITEMEKLVHGLWKELFPHHEISSTDDFFRDLGGYSLLASKFISTLRNEKGFTKVSVLDIYENPNVRSFASILEAQTERVHYSPEFKPIPLRRYYLAKVWQALGILFIFGLQGLFWLGPIIAAIYFSNESGHSDFHALLLGIALHAASVPILVLIAVAIKWIVGGRFKPGSYPLWGTTFIRWWFVHRLLAIAPVTFITGSPVAAIYMRMLGAKVGRNVFFESLEFDCPDLIEVGNDCSFENSSWFHPSEVAHGELHLRRIKVGNGCTVGVRSGISGGGVMEDGSSLRDLSCATNGVTIPKGEEWLGSVARKSDSPELPPYDPNDQPSTGRLALFTAVQFVLVFVLALLDSTPFVTVAFTLYNWSEGLNYLWEPVYAVVLVCFGAVQVLIIKWAVLGKLKPGTYDYPGWYWLRKWFSDKHLELASGLIVPIYDSLFARPWCIALGMKCGARCEIALPRRMPYDLVSMGEESFLASEVSIGRPIRRNGKITLERTSVGKRAFLGNDSVVPQGTHVPDEFLLGVLSVCPRNDQIKDEQDQAWLGSPPFKMPHRQVLDHFDPKHTYSPTIKMYAQRLAHEAVRIVLPSLCSLIVASILIEGFGKIWNMAEDWSEYPFAIALAFIPIIYLVGVLVAALICRISKFVLIGTYRPTIQPLWSQFVWKTETHSAVLHDFAAPMFISDLEGTSYMSAFLKLLGARVGRRAYIDTTDWTETDLIHIGEDVAINANAPLQAHLFEDRVMKVGAIKIGSRCSVGNYSVILCDSELKPDAHVGHLSLVMKGETIPSQTYWKGSPAQSVEESAPDLARV